MTQLSNFLLNGSSPTLQGKAGSSAINTNDLLVQTLAGQLFPIQTTDYGIFPSTGAMVPTVTVTSTYNSAPSGKNCYVNPTDLSSFIATSNASSNGLSIYKYSSLGVLVTSKLLDSTAAIPMNICIIPLSNGNLAVVWGLYTHTIQFAILDINLNIIVANTSITASAAYDNSNNTFLDAIALSGGGFAVSYAMTNGMYLAIYTNTGSVTYAGTLIPSTPTTDNGASVAAAPKMIQLSSGNIAIAISSTTTSQALGHCIRTVTGTAVLAYTVLNSSSLASGPTVAYPDINTIAGTYCVGLSIGNTSGTVYVLSNAGALQGSAYSLTISGSTTKIVNDGTSYWALIGSGGYVGSLVYIPVTGSGYVANSLTTTTVPNYVIYDKGYVISNSGIYQIGTAGSASYFSAGISGSTAYSLPDFSIITSTNNPTTFTITKYVSTNVIGISQSTLAAGNAGTTVSFLQGPGTYTCNALIGTLRKVFGAVFGNTGIILGTTVVLKGINASSRSIA